MIKIRLFKGLLVFCLCIFSMDEVNSQKYIWNYCNSILFGGISNHIDFSFPGMNCDSLEISVNASEAYVDRISSCSVNISPLVVNKEIEIKLVVKSTKKVVTTTKFWVALKTFDNAYLQGGFRNTSVPTGVLLGSSGIVVPLENINASGHCQVVSFDVEVKKSGQEIYKETFNSAKFTKEFCTIISILHKGDMLFFKNIKAINVDTFIVGENFWLETSDEYYNFEHLKNIRPPFKNLTDTIRIGNSYLSYLEKGDNKYKCITKINNKVVEAYDCNIQCKEIEVLNFNYENFTEEVSKVKGCFPIINGVFETYIYIGEKRYTKLMETVKSQN